MKTRTSCCSVSSRNRNSARRGSTLVIVIALLGLLMTLGITFYSYAFREREASALFSEGAKGVIDDPPNVWDHMNRQIISGTDNRRSDRSSILRSLNQRLSLVSNMVGRDVYPHTGTGVNVTYGGVDLPTVPTPPGNDWLEFVDSPVARNGVEERIQTPPEPDVDYTYPDINNLFLAYKGTAIRDNGTSIEQVPVIIPSFFRPQYMKSSTTNGPGGNHVPTDLNWASAFDGTLRTTMPFAGRSFRPHAQHIAGFQSDGVTPVFRYLTDTEATTLGIAAGGFPLVPADNLATQPGGANGVRGELGIWTGSDPLAYELDSDNDGDGIKEGIWLDLNFPVQEAADGRLYVVLHSVTIYDLDSLIDLNVHGNLAGLNRDGNITNGGPGLVRDGLMSSHFISRSNQGLGPNEINPLWALRRTINPLVDSMDPDFTSYANTRNQFDQHYTRLPTSDVEQANMEYLWLLTGRGEFDTVTLENLYAGRWGETDRLFNTIRSGTGTRLVADLPRPGSSENGQVSLSSGIRYGGSFSTAGRNGFDDNFDRFDGETDPSLARTWPFVHPMDFAGTGRTHQATVASYGGTNFTVGGNPRLPVLGTGTIPGGPERWPGYVGYSICRAMATGNPRYLFGQNGLFNDADDLIANPFFDALFEDPLEMVFDRDASNRQSDEPFSAQDLLDLMLTRADFDRSPDELSTRMSDLAPFALERSTTNSNRGRFTTISNSLRRFMMRHDLGNDLKLGTADDGVRAWEFSADTDGADNNQEGFADGDGFLEFPPAFGTNATDGRPYSPTDPFRPQVRRLLTVEPGETRELLGQLPLSPNHILDVERTAQTPDEVTNPNGFLYYLQQAGMRFRPLTEHPSATETEPGATTPAREAVTTVPDITSGLRPFPPTTLADREFWARRDRQKLARDIFVLLYTTGGAEFDGVSAIRNYTASNNDASPVLYSEDRVRQMAQFAANLVDAMDSDNIITKFEYDKDLGDGWGLDDDPYTHLPATDPAASATNVATSLTPPLDHTRGGMYPDDSGDRGVVYGVEAQQLAISEILAVRSRKLANDHAATHFDDTHADSSNADPSLQNDFLFVELQNLQPTALPLGSSLTTGETVDKTIWRLVRRDRAAVADPINERNEGIITPPTHFIAFATDTAGNNIVSGGGRFSVSATSAVGLAGTGTPLPSSDLFVDVGQYDSGTTRYVDGPLTDGFDGTYELIAPNATTGTLPTTGTPATDPQWDPRCDVDILAHIGLGVFYQSATSFMDAIGDVAGTATPYAGHEANGPLDNLTVALAQPLGPAATNFVAAGNEAGLVSVPTTEPGFDLVLQRRLNPELPSITDASINPWIDVDRARVKLIDFDIDTADTAAVIRDDAVADVRLSRVRSWERAEPLNDIRTAHAPVTTTTFAYRSNTLKGDVTVPSNDTLGINSATNSTTGFQLWQPHFDREFASSGEFLNLPLYGPGMTTQKLALSKLPPFQQLGSVAVPNDLNAAGANSMFLWPDRTPDAGDPGQVSDNAWYRLFQFVEVPSRVHRMLGNYLTLDRVPGKLNVNMIRDWEVYAGLIDNPMILDDATGLGLPNNITVDRTLNNASNPVNRDRWLELLEARDGQSVVGFNPTTGMPADFVIPGTPNAQPFRSPGFRTTGNADDGSQQTFVRTLPQDRIDGVPATNRTLLEVADAVQHVTPGVTNSVHQHQLLMKVMNNTTTVSNTFIMYATAAYFQAHEDPATGLIQVGGRMDLNGTDDANPGWQQRAVFVIDRTEGFKAYDAGSGSFDWKRLIKHRATLE
jgi:hypothetical protein